MKTLLYLTILFLAIVQNPFCQQNYYEEMLKLEQQEEIDNYIHKLDVNEILKLSDQIIIDDFNDETIQGLVYLIYQTGLFYHWDKELPTIIEIVDILNDNTLFAETRFVAVLGFIDDFSDSLSYRDISKLYLEISSFILNKNIVDLKVKSDKYYQAYFYDMLRFLDRKIIDRLRNDILSENEIDLESIEKLNVTKLSILKFLQEFYLDINYEFLLLKSLNLLRVIHVYANDPDISSFLYIDSSYNNLKQGIDHCKSILMKIVNDKMKLELLPTIFFTLPDIGGHDVNSTTYYEEIKEIIRQKGLTKIDDMSVDHYLRSLKRALSK